MGEGSASIETGCMTAVDTNVLVYAIDVDEPVKQQKAEDLLSRLSQAPTQTLLLRQVVAEFLGVLRRWRTAAKIAGQDVEGHLHDAMILFPIVLPATAALDRSTDLSRRSSLSHWDSLLLAACIEAGVDTLYSEDLTDGMTYDSVTVVNPFA